MNREKKNTQEKLIVGKRVKALREQKGLTLKELSTKAGVSIGFIGDIESGRGKPSLITLNKLAEALETTTDYLLGRTDDPRPVEEIKNSPEIQEAHRRIEEALAGDPDAEELLEFWKEMKEREDLFLLFKQVRPLSDDSIRRIIRVIKAIEDEEAQEFGDGR